MLFIPPSIKMDKAIIHAEQIYYHSACTSLKDDDSKEHK